MANSDYVVRTTNYGFCPVGFLSASISRLQTAVTMTGFSSSISGGGIRIGMAAMIDDEIVVVSARSGDNLTLGRGCCDTIPATHDAGAPIWFFDDYIGRETTEFMGTEVIGVKVQPRTLTGGPVPIEYAPAKTVAMNLRFARPYAPGLMRVNGTQWFDAYTLASAGSLVLTWKHRDRVVQQDQLVDHTQDNIGPEVGTTYEIKVYKNGTTLVRTESVSGNTWTYTYAQALSDFAESYGDWPGTIVVAAKRDGLLSYQSYTINFTLDLPTVPYGLGWRLGEHLGGYPI